MSATCSIAGCGAKVLGRGWCSKHYDRWRRNGDPEAIARRPNGSGSPDGADGSGYVRHHVNGKLTRDHIVVAERALGRKLPAGAQVHHVDENKQNNSPRNLVICQDDAYHKLLHQRARALKACGHASFRRCPFCKTYGDPADMVSFGASGFAHRECRQTYNTAYQARTRVAV